MSSLCFHVQLIIPGTNWLANYIDCHDWDALLSEYKLFVTENLLLASAELTAAVFITVQAVFIVFGIYYDKPHFQQLWKSLTSTIYIIILNENIYLFSHSFHVPGFWN
jgi:hypothetical protein